MGPGAGSSSQSGRGAVRGNPVRPSAVGARAGPVRGAGRGRGAGYSRRPPGAAPVPVQGSPSAGAGALQRSPQIPGSRQHQTTGRALGASRPCAAAGAGGMVWQAVAGAWGVADRGAARAATGSSRARPRMVEENVGIRMEVTSGG
nr:hypothetical protein [uncultured bacterium]